MVWKIICHEVVLVWLLSVVLVFVTFSSGSWEAAWSLTADQAFRRVQRGGQLLIESNLDDLGKSQSSRCFCLPCALIWINMGRDSLGGNLVSIGRGGGGNGEGSAGYAVLWVSQAPCVPWQVSRGRWGWPCKAVTDSLCGGLAQEGLGRSSGAKLWEWLQKKNTPAVLRQILSQV